MTHYATFAETTAMVRQATPSELWLHEQLDRINPERHEMGSAGDAQAMTILVFQLKDANTQLVGEAKVLRDLLKECTHPIATIDCESQEEHECMATLLEKIVGAL